MKIHRIESRNFLSFDYIDLDIIPEDISVVVGPNGSGKSNLMRALRMIRDACNFERRSAWKLARRTGSPNREFSAALLLELTDESEIQLVTIFLKAVLASIPNLSGATAERHARWVEDVSARSLGGFRNGLLKVACAAGQWWTVEYIFDHEGVTYQWMLDGPQPGIRQLGIDTGWNDLYPISALLRASSSKITDEALAEVHSRPFELRDILPGPGENLQQVEVALTRGGQLPEPLLRFSELAGLDISRETGARSGLFVFAKLLSHGLLVTDDLRMWPETTWPWEVLARREQPLDLADSTALPLHLFQLKTGPAEARTRYQQAQEIFRGLSGKSFELMVANETTSGTVRLLITINEAGGEVPLELAGAGLRESLVLSVALSAPDRTVLCLDEPALNLHPNLQRTIVRLTRRRGGQTIIITHSPYMVPSESESDLARVFRFYMSEGSTKIARINPLSVPPEAHQARARWLKEIGRDIGTSALLFARAVILVEGETELGALPVWFSKSKTAGVLGGLEDHNFAVHHVGGALGFGTYIQLMQAFSIPWAALCDPDRFADPAFWDQFGLSQPPGDESFDQTKERISRQGIFTLADTPGQTFEDLSYVRPLVGEARREVGASKPRSGRYIAQKTECPPEVDNLLEKLLKHFGETPRWELKLP